MTFAPNEDARPRIRGPWTVDETLTTAYAKGQHRHDGAQCRCAAMSASRSSTPTSRPAPAYDHTRPAGSEIQPFEDGKTYTDVLPSLNLAFAIADDQTLRLALAKTGGASARGPAARLARFRHRHGHRQARRHGGNLRLDPWRANASTCRMRNTSATRATWPPRSSTRT